jgi:predicted SnoaL-like aldol condensation-catalyzing enzyme
MKRFQPMFLTTLIIMFAAISCTSSNSDNASAENKDTTAASENASANSGNEKSEANKKLVTDFYQALYGDKDSNAIDKYVADDIKQHNPALQDGKEWLKKSLRPFLENSNIEKTKVDIKQTAADGDLVWLLVRDVAPNGKEFARVNIFKVDNDKISEAWKVSEPVPAKSANKNGMF